MAAHLDFINTSDDKIRELFLKPKCHNRSTDSDGCIIFPPRAIRRTATEIRDFFNMGIKDKRQKIEQCRNFQIDTDQMISYLDSEFASQGEQEPIRRAFALSNEPAGQAQDIAGEEDFGDDEEFGDDIELEFGQTLSKIWSTKAATSDVCPGITISYIQNMRLDDEIMTRRILGFKHTIREGFTTRARLEHPDRTEKWPFCLPVVGAIAHGNIDTEIVWRVEEVDGYINSNSDEDGPEFERFIIKHVDCSGGITKQGLCSHCFRKKKLLLDRFDSNVKSREEEVKINTRTTLARTFSLQNKRTEYYQRKAKNLSARLSYKQMALNKLTVETGMDVEINETSDSIFNYSVASNVAKYLAADGDNTNAAAEFIFRESVRKYQDAKTKHASSVRHSQLVIRLGALIYQKMGNGGDLYNLVAKIMGLPTDRTIRRYKSSSVNDPDGVLLSNLEAARLKFDLSHPGCDKDDFKRHVSLAYDEMSVKGRFSVNYHTNTLVGIADDAFERSVIEREFELLAADWKNGDEDCEDDDSKITVPEATKYFLGFMATTLDASTGSKQHIFTARYGVKKTQYTFLARRLKEIPAILYNYGFIVTQIGNDGAIENRTVSKFTATITAADILPAKFTEHELRGLNLDFPIAYQHPSPACENKYIFFGGDMPHLVKKIRNAFDNKSRTLTFRNRLMNLAMIKSIWLKYESSGSGLRKTHLGYDHFELDAYKKMRVFPAMQVMSQSTITMIEECCADEENDEDINKYKGMIELFGKINRLVDICNGYGADQVTKSGKRRDVEKIDHPKHRHILELFDILRVVEEWKAECGGLNAKFITKQTYEDLLWLVYGLAGVASYYLKEDRSLSIDQGRLGSDIMEHFFSMIRDSNSNPNLGQANSAAGKIGSVNAIIQGGMFRKGKRKQGGGNSAGAQEDKEAYLQPLPGAKYTKRN